MLKSVRSKLKSDSSKNGSREPTPVVGFSAEEKECGDCCGNRNSSSTVPSFPADVSDWTMDSALSMTLPAWTFAFDLALASALHRLRQVKGGWPGRPAEISDQL